MPGLPSAQEKEEEEMPGLPTFPEKARFRNEDGPSLPTPASVFLHPTVVCVLWSFRKGPRLAAGTSQGQQPRGAPVCCLPATHVHCPSAREALVWPDRGVPTEA